MAEMTAELARQIWDYRPETGTLTWAIPPCAHVSAGDVAGSSNHGYLDVKYKGVHYLVHRLVWLITTGEWPVNEIDHINGIRDDNRISNLREATSRENKLNLKCHRKGKLAYTTYVGARGKWMARTPRIEGRQKNIGYYNTMEEANAVAEQWIRDNLSEGEVCGN